MKRKLIAALLVFGVCLGVVVTRAVWEGRSALERADEAAARGELTEAITWYRRAARWYVPLAPHVGRAYDRLEQIAQQAEANDDLDTALAAWRGVRSSIKATRSVFTPHAERLDPANQRIAALMARVEDPALDPDKSEAQRAQWHYALLGFATWLGGGVLFALRGVSAEDKLEARAAATAGLIVAAGLVVWMIGLHNA